MLLWGRQVHDIEDLAKEGRRLTGCPYFASRHFAEDAELVFCPYRLALPPPPFPCSTDLGIQRVKDDAHLDVRIHSISRLGACVWQVLRLSYKGQCGVRAPEGAPSSKFTMTGALWLASLSLCFPVTCAGVRRMRA